MIEKFKSYTQMQPRKLMRDHDMMIDMLEDLAERLEAAEAKVKCLSESCATCKGGECKPKKAADSK